MTFILDNRSYQAPTFPDLNRIFSPTYEPPLHLIHPTYGQVPYTTPVANTLNDSLTVKMLGSLSHALQSLGQPWA